jgi:hypothetical protein
MPVESFLAVGPATAGLALSATGVLNNDRLLATLAKIIQGHRSCLRIDQTLRNDAQAVCLFAIDTSFEATIYVGDLGRDSGRLVVSWRRLFHVCQCNQPNYVGTLLLAAAVDIS